MSPSLHSFHSSLYSGSFLISLFSFFLSILLSRLLFFSSCSFLLSPSFVFLPAQRSVFFSISFFSSLVLPFPVSSSLALSLSCRFVPSLSSSPSLGYFSTISFSRYALFFLSLLSSHPILVPSYPIFSPFRAFTYPHALRLPLSLLPHHLATLSFWP